MTKLLEKEIPPSTFALSPEESKDFHHQGYLGPFTLCSPDEMAEIRAHIESEVLEREHPREHQSRHLDNRVVYNLCSHPAIVDRITSLMGPDLLLWRSNFFNKKPGGQAIPWHQDLNYWPIEPLINLSAWLAIDEVTEENSCVQIIPGSHKEIIPHVKAKEDDAFTEMADPHYFDDSTAIKMELKPGQFFLFTERLLHYSDPNRSNKRRLGLAVRTTVPWVRVDSPNVCLDHHCLLLQGEDRFGFNKMGTPPE